MDGVGGGGGPVRNVTLSTAGGGWGRNRYVMYLKLLTYCLSFFYLAMTFGSSQEHRVLARVLPWLAIGDFHHIMSSTNALCQQLVSTAACS
jgi:hypothetical protein